SLRSIPARNPAPGARPGSVPGVRSAEKLAQPQKSQCSSAAPFFLKQERTKRQRVQWRGPETLKRIARCADNWLTARIERRIHQNRNSCALLKGLQQIVV